MSRTGDLADCCLLCMIHASYILNPLSNKALDGSVPLDMLYGVSPDISIILLYTFYQPVFYATHNQSYPFVSEETTTHWVGFGEHTHKLLDDETKKILYRSAVGAQILPILTKDWYQIEGRAPRLPNPLSLLGLCKILVNPVLNPW